uniref:EML-like first beta-propeller domain-containing protein n=3 Tax=Hemiselmis andersenii TaxID=464988 RepID=A0A7S1HLU2_HEMAN|mmetsp:Transcript_7334/g.17691  ORF Transcript_7334/g.17691 Transcript_7334/m.17691 type:complete len:619 (+) Transcript_7334:235-2091(+)
MELEHAIGFGGKIRSCLLYHPNNRDIVYTAGGCVVIADMSDPHNQVFLRGHDDYITCIALSPSGRYIASGQQGENADVIVWDFDEKRLVYRLQSHDTGIACVSFSHDEKLLLSVGCNSDNRLFVWDMSSGLMTGQSAAVEKTDSQDIRCAVFGGFLKDIKRRDTQNYMFITAGQRCIRLWALDPHTGAWVHQGDGLTSLSHVRDYTCICFSPDRKYVFVGSTTGDVTVFDTKAKAMADSKQVCQGGVDSLLVLPGREEGTYLLMVGGGHGALTKLHAEGAKLSFVRDGSTQLLGGVTSLSLSGDGEEALAGTSLSYMYRARIDDLRTVLVSENHSDSVTFIAFPPDSSDRFATCSTDGTIRMWDLSDYRVLCKGVCKDGGVPYCMAFALECLLSGWSDGFVRCFDAETGEMLWKMSDVHRGGVTALGVSHNHRFMVTGGEEGDVRVWDIKQRDMVVHLKEHNAAVTSISIFSDDAHCLTASRDRNILSWDLRREKRIASLRQRMGGVNSVALASDQIQVVSVGQERRLTFWDLRDPEPVAAVNLPDEATANALSNNGRFVACGGKDQVVRVFDFEQNRLLMEGAGHSGCITCVRFSPDDRQLVSTGEDGCIFVWNIYA